MDQISQHINSSNNKSYSLDKIIKTIVNLGSKKREDKNSSTCQFNHLKNLLSIIIVDIPEKNVSKLDRKIDKSKICTS